LENLIPNIYTHNSFTELQNLKKTLKNPYEMKENLKKKVLYFFERLPTIADIFDFN